MAVDIAGKVAWVRSHPMVPVAVLCSSVVLLIPRVQSVLMFFWPLLVSTALMFVTALLALGKAHLDEEDHQRHLVDEIGECSFHQQQEEDVVADEPDRSLLACVAEQHEGGIIHFDSMFQPLPSPSSGVEVNHKASMVGIEDQRDDKHINLNNKVADDSVGEMVVANAQEDKSEIIPAAQELHAENKCLKISPHPGCSTPGFSGHNDFGFPVFILNSVSSKEFCCGILQSVFDIELAAFLLKISLIAVRNQTIILLAFFFL